MGFRYQHRESHSFLFSLQSTTRAADILQKVDDYFKKWDLKWENLSTVFIDGAPGMIGAQSGFSKRAKELAPGATSLHCIVHC